MADQSGARNGAGLVCDICTPSVTRANPMSPAARSSNGCQIQITSLTGHGEAAAQGAGGDRIERGLAQHFHQRAPVRTGRLAALLRQKKAHGERGHVHRGQHVNLDGRAPWAPKASVTRGMPKLPQL